MFGGGKCVLGVCEGEGGECVWYGGRGVGP